MLRSIKSGQRKVRIISVKISGTSGSLSVSGLDEKKVSVNASDELIFNEVFAAAPDVHASTVGTVTKDKVTGVAAGMYLIIGSDTTEKY